ncbi:TetR/AcrR family transcriptional regulator [Paenibacillus monticola]|uniref:TetR family transcriptional regulator n=1 Tax=Paenibacillus monticola TaxID=2666075 RepID=A0A7X2H7W9_9BACL|nr:TetR/AcrR family transcriptional regulator [Paenibacillus monticola]MRN55174.1 TetR family transcriptional regulator [Paenibacillus monticola]
MNTTDNNVDHSDKDTKQTILNATVRLIREDGLQCATLRKIAAKADTNIALVNYYYGSKDNLISDAVRVLLSTFDDAFKALEDNSLSPKERLKQFFIGYIANLEQYPGLARQMIDQGHNILASQDEYTRYAKTMRMKHMHAALREITNEQDEVKLRMMMLQLYGAIIFPLTMSSCSPGVQNKLETSFQFPSIETQIEALFEHYFYKYNI